eukprot:3464233-Pleurochrysis_carterae.AAC.1
MWSESAASSRLASFVIRCVRPWSPSSSHAPSSRSRRRQSCRGHRAPSPAARARDGGADASSSTCLKHARIGQARTPLSLAGPHAPCELRVCTCVPVRPVECACACATCVRESVRA